MKTKFFVEDVSFRVCDGRNPGGHYFQITHGLQRTPNGWFERWEAVEIDVRMGWRGNHSFDTRPIIDILAYPRARAVVLKNLHARRDARFAAALHALKRHELAATLAARIEAMITSIHTRRVERNDPKFGLKKENRLRLALTGDHSRLTWSEKRELEIE